jgi:NAD-dependent dihydropyrimidine dehydrogenase PreA subunit
MKVDPEKCNGCGFCVRDCPVGAVRLVKKKAVFEENCTDCGACIRVCEQEALERDEVPATGAIQCDACPIGCWIKPGYIGACHRYKNVDKKLVRVTPIHAYDTVADIVGLDPTEPIRRPLITAIGAGTTYPDCKPAPAIVKGKKQDVDVVTVVTEAPLSYSGITVKIDTDVPVGEEGAPVLVGKRKVAWWSPSNMALRCCL